MNSMKTRSGLGINMISFVLPGWKDKNPMPPKAAHERSRVKQEMSSMTNHRKAATRVYLSRGAGFLPHEMERKS